MYTEMCMYIPNLLVLSCSSGSSGLWSLVSTWGMIKGSPGSPKRGFLTPMIPVESPTLATYMWFFRKITVEAVVPAVLKSPYLLGTHEAI